MRLSIRVELRPALAWLPRKPVSIRPLSCRDNLRLFTGLAGMGRKEARAAIDDLAELLGLTELLDRRAKELSGGERRRLHTAIALVGRPSLVLLDEPTVGADVQTRSQLLGVVRDLARKGAAVVYSTHYFPEVTELDASVVILDADIYLLEAASMRSLPSTLSGRLSWSSQGRLLMSPDYFPSNTVTTSGSWVWIETNETAAVTAVILANLDAHAVKPLRSHSLGTQH